MQSRMIRLLCLQGRRRPEALPSLTTFDWLFNRIRQPSSFPRILNRFSLNSKKQTLSNSRKHLKFCLHELDLSACAVHGWDKVAAKDVYHAGRKVGVITDTLGEDIGLVETSASFNNTLLDVNTTAQRLLHSSLLKFGQFLITDSAFTSRQRLRCFGVRIGLRRPPPGPSPNKRYAVVVQGIFAGRSLLINAEPQLRLGMCGSPLIPSGEYLEDESYLRHEHIAGFMSWTDITGYDVAGKLYAYCQVCDPLINEGWEVCAN